MHKKSTVSTGVSEVPEYFPPVFNEKRFTCPHCGAFACMDWAGLEALRTEHPLRFLRAATCQSCGLSSYWKMGAIQPQMIYPAIHAGPTAHPRMPAHIKADFEEARAVFNVSPRGAAALLRLCVQKICIALGQPGKDLNADIGALVRSGLPVKAQQALDVVRVVGNNAVHPGTLDVRDDADLVKTLLGLVNYLVEDLIARPAELQELLDKLPQGAIYAIEKRDARPT